MQTKNISGTEFNEILAKKRKEKLHLLAFVVILWALLTLYLTSFVGHEFGAIPMLAPMTLFALGAITTWICINYSKKLRVPRGVWILRIRTASLQPKRTAKLFRSTKNVRYGDGDLCLLIPSEEFRFFVMQDGTLRAALFESPPCNSILTITLKVKRSKESALSFAENCVCHNLEIHELNDTNHLLAALERTRMKVFDLMTSPSFVRVTFTSKGLPEGVAFRCNLPSLINFMGLQVLYARPSNHEIIAERRTYAKASTATSS